MSRKAIIGLMLAMALISAAAAAGATILTLRTAGRVEAAAPEPAASEQSHLVPLTRFLTDLADRQRRRYVEVSMSLVVPDEAAVAAVQAQMPEVRDAVLGYLRTQGADELLGSVGKERLAEALARELTPLVPGGVRRVFITDLLVN